MAMTARQPRPWHPPGGAEHLGDGSLGLLLGPQGYDDASGLGSVKVDKLSSAALAVDKKSQR
jgi:hypothetical protein